MATGFYTHKDCLGHVTPEGHPERVARLQAILEKLADPAFDSLIRKDAKMGTDEQILLAHPQSYLDRIKSAIPIEGTISLDGDTHVMKGSLIAALRGVGAICDAVDDVLGGKIDNAFCATRPPGHHAETSTPMGFCLFGTAAIGAKHALNSGGLERVAIVDFDVHHGNGTQDLVWNDPNIHLVTSQQMPLWPGTGESQEKGAHNNVTNIPLRPETDGSALLKHYQETVFPKLRNFNPQMLIISAGFDAHIKDPLANLAFSTEDFRALTNALCVFANEHCDGRVVSTLEGGYDLEALADATATHISVLMEHSK